MIPRPDVDREIIRRRGLHEFIRRGWGEVVPTPFVDNWHIGFICEHVQAVERGQIKRLIINQPPGTMKSLTVSVFYPAWAWTEVPERKFMYITYEQALSTDMASKQRDLVGSDWYQQRWDVSPNARERRKNYFVNSKGGSRFSTSINGGATGRHVDRQVIDDPTNPKELQGSAEQARKALQKTVDRWQGVFSTRRSDPKTFARIIMMQRLHDGDLCGVELLDQAAGYVHLMLPMRYEVKRRCTTVLGSDIRTQDGELLWPERFPPEQVEELARSLGSAAEAQLQQNPVPADGGTFKLEWLQNYWCLPHEPIPGCIPLPAVNEMSCCQSWDMTFKESDQSDYVAAGVWGRKGGQFFLFDRLRRRMGFSDTVQAMITLSAKHPRILAKIVEDKANGPAVADALKKKIGGIELVNPEGGKESRANAVSSLFASGSVFLPHPSIAPWVTEYQDEMIRFPKGAHDDEVDQTTQALLRLYVRTPRIVEAMKKMKADAMRPPIPETPTEKPPIVAPKADFDGLLAKIRGDRKVA